MVDETNGHDQEALAAAARHALHDEELISALAGDELEDGDEAGRARALIARCAVCRDLFADLRAIRAVTQAIPAAALVTAPRDFRLTRDDAARLRPGFAVLRWRDRWIEALTAVARPAGASFAALGVAGLLLATLGFGLGGHAASAPTLGSAPASSAAAAAQQPAPASTSAAGGAFEANPQGTDARNVLGGPQATAQPQFDNGQPKAQDTGTRPSAGPFINSLALLLVGSALALALGILLLVFARGRARRSR